MTVAENIQVAVPLEHLRRRDPDARKAMRSLLDDVHFDSHLEDRVSSLSVARRHLLELAKAFAVSKDDLTPNVVSLLTKPFSPRELLQIVTDALASVEAEAVLT